MKRTVKRILSCVLCLLLLLSLLPVGALSVSDDSNETDQVVIGPGLAPKEEYLISEGTLEFSSQEESSNGIYINFVAASNGTVSIDLLETDHDYCVVVYENDWWLTRFTGIDAPDTVEFSVKAGGQYNVIFSVVDYQTPTLDAWLPVAGFLTYRMTSDVPVSDIVRWPHEDPRQILLDAYALEDGHYLPYGATLTGEIIRIKTPYDSYYQNISVVMEVPGCEEMPILCYRLAGEGADTLTVGDTITVSGRISNYYGTIEFEQGCVLDGVVKGDNEIPVPPEDPMELVDAAYALAEGDNLPYIASLTGTILSIDTPYDEDYRNITVTIAVEGRETKPILCYRMKGQAAETLVVGDVITVSGVLANYRGTIEFQSGCTLLEIVGPYAWGPDSLAIVGDGLPGIRVWDPADPAGDMTEVAPCFYQLTLECPANTLMHFKFAGNDMWDDAWNFGDTAVILGQQVELPCGPSTSDITLQVDEACTLLFTVDLSPMRDGGNAMLLVNKVKPTPQPRPLIVYAPDSWEKVYAYTWEPETFGSYPGRELQNQGNYYTETINSDMENLILTGYLEDTSCRQTSDIHLQPGDDIVVVFVFEDGTYDVTYDAGPIWDNYGSLTIAGSGLPGIREWDPMDTAGDMVNIGDGVFQKILSFTEPTTIYFRIVSNHDWFSGHAGGGSIVLGEPITLDSTAGSPDLYLDIPEACQLKFTVDLNDGYVDKPGTLLVEKVTARKIKVKAPVAWTGVDAYTWEPESLGVFPGTAMQKNGNVFELTVPADMTNLVLSGVLEDGTRQQYTDMYLEPGSNDLLIDISNESPIVPDFTRKLTVYAPASWENVNVYTWEPETFNYWPGTQMQNCGGYFEMMIPQSMVNLVLNSIVSNGNMLQTTDITLETNGLDVTVYITDDNSYVVEYENPDFRGPDSLAIVGSGLSGIREWDPADPAGDMTQISDYVYQKTLEFTAGTDISFKIVGNDIWSEQWIFGGTDLALGQTIDLQNYSGSQDLRLFVENDCRLTFTVDLTPMLHGGNATLLVEPIINTYLRPLYVVVPDSWGDICLYTWEPEHFGPYPGQQPEEIQDGVYRAIISSELVNLVISGTFADGTDWYTGEIQLETGVRPVTVVLREDFTYSIIYDNSPISGVDVFRVVGNAAWMGMWDSASDAGLMEETSEGVYQKRFESVQPGSYEFKITRNGTWDDAIGGAGGTNLTFEVTKVSDVVVTCVFDAGEVRVSIQIVPLPLGDVTGDGKLNMGDVARLYAHVRSTKILIDAAALHYADFNGDGKINIGDTAAIYSYIRQTYGVT